MAGARNNWRRVYYYGIPIVSLLTVILYVVVQWSRSRPVNPFAAERAINAPLGASAELRDVVEPITPVRGESWAGSDDHWFGVTFRDARGVERTARFVFYWPSAGQGDPETKRMLLLGSTRCEPSGDEERACLGLLERWWRGNTAAQALWDRVQQRDPTLRPVLGGFEGITPAEVGQIMAARLMFRLRTRN